MQHKITGQQVDVALTDLNDTLIISPQTNDVLTYVGGQWINGAPQGGGSAQNVTAWGQALYGLGRINGHSSINSVNHQIQDPTGQTGIFNYLPFLAGTGDIAIGLGDDDAPVSPSESGEPVVISSVNDPYNIMNGATTITTPPNHRGSEWQITLELVLDPTYLGFDQNYPDNNSSAKNVTVNFQFWSLFPTTDTQFTQMRPMHQLSTTAYVYQKNKDVNPYGVDLSAYYPSLVASGSVWLPPGTTTVTWFSHDIPLDTNALDPYGNGAVQATGQQFTHIAGYRLSMHRVMEGATFVPPTYYLTKDTAYIATIPTNQVTLSQTTQNDSTPIWTKFTVTTTGTYQMDTAGSNQDTVIGLFSSTGNLLATNDDALAPQSRITQSLSPGDYYCVLGDYQTNFSPAFGVSQGTGGGLIKFSIVQL